MSAERGDEDGLSMLGWCYMGGWGTKEHNRLGLAYLMEGATLGSEYGCNLVGDAFADGFWGLPKDVQLATKWYLRMDTCKSKSSDDATRSRVIAWVRKHAKAGAVPIQELWGVPLPDGAASLVTDEDS
jgi:TPR repeat protein